MSPRPRHTQPLRTRLAQRRIEDVAARHARCINCAHAFVAAELRCYYGEGPHQAGPMNPAREVGPFCEGCYALIKRHEEPLDQRRSLT